MNIFKSLVLAILVAYSPCFTAKNLQSEKPLTLADPYVFYEKGWYYAYGTHSFEGIEVYRSKDLITWQFERLALESKNTKTNKWFWAPEVYHIKGKYLMYFSGNENIRAAWSDSPLGPFVEAEESPLLKRKPHEGNIDNHLFIDDDGKAYIFFVEWGYLGTSMAELEKDCLTVDTTTIKGIITPQQSWEKKLGQTNEGPFILKHKGYYYLTYSGNDFRSQDYAIGVAISNKITGPWKKVDYNPILRRCKGLVGVGHHSFFKNKNGKILVAFHSHKSTKGVSPREMHIANVKFCKSVNGEPDILKIDTTEIIHCKVIEP